MLLKQEEVEDTAIEKHRQGSVSVCNICPVHPIDPVTLPDHHPLKPSKLDPSAKSQSSGDR